MNNRTSIQTCQLYISTDLSGTCINLGINWSHTGGAVKETHMLFQFWLKLPSWHKLLLNFHWILHYLSLTRGSPKCVYFLHCVPSVSQESSIKVPANEKLDSRFYRESALNTQIQVSQSHRLSLLFQTRRLLNVSLYIVNSQKQTYICTQ